VISQRLLGTTEIAVFHHTDCGMLTFTNDDIRQKVKSEEPGNAAVAEAVDNIDFLPFPDLKQSVKDDIDFLKGSKLLKKDTHLSGWIYDVKSGKVCWIFLIPFLIERLKLMFCGHIDYICN
jgi:carbonic anhydrase